MIDSSPRWLKIPAAVMLFIFLNGCATAFNPYKHEIKFFNGTEGNISHEGATIWIDDKPLKIKSFYERPHSFKNMGSVKLYENEDPYHLSKGYAMVQIRKSLFAKDSVLEIRKPLYKTQKILLTRTLDSSFYWNILNIIGFGADIYTGSMWNISNQVIMMNFIEGKGDIWLNSSL